MPRLFSRVKQMRSDRAAVHPRHPGWPEATPAVFTPANIHVRLRPLDKNDKSAWRMMRLSDQRFLEPVEPTVEDTWQSAHSSAAWRSYIFSLRQAAFAGSLVPMSIEANGQFVGQLTIGSIQHGISSDAWIGYWVHSSVTGQGIATAACALGVDHAFRRVRVHRLTATYLPHNIGSQKVLVRCGFRHEGYLERNLHINGMWREHYLMAQTNDEFTSPCVDRLIASRFLRRA